MLLTEQVAMIFLKKWTFHLTRTLLQVSRSIRRMARSNVGDPDVL